MARDAENRMRRVELRVPAREMMTRVVVSTTRRKDRGDASIFRRTEGDASIPTPRKSADRLSPRREISAPEVVLVEVVPAPARPRATVRHQHARARSKTLEAARRVEAREAAADDDVVDLRRSGSAETREPSADARRPSRGVS